MTMATSTINLYRIEMSKDVLQTLPSDERTLLFLSSQAFNQISVMQKMLLFSTNFDGRDDVEDYLASGQSQVVLRYLAGSLAETWMMLRRESSRKLIDGKYLDILSEDGRVSYDTLKRAFGKHGLLYKIRNKIAYHFPSEAEIAEAFDEIPVDEDLSWYASETYANTFYLGSDKLLSMIEMKLTGLQEPRDAFALLVKLLVDVANDVVNFLTCLMREIISNRLGSSLLEVRQSDAVVYANIPHMSDVKIPFFIYRD